ncbi:alpha-ketoglutarate-dependent dioxygenase AlkB [Sphingomonas sp.]|uniref:alpha-ketoglutarate-dependent dioxygenase AlkB n=1 Tax=Sphingomonas sp. TaxID=28214 RepID=UPI0025D44D23|nr:alpha-ketoglutarate-dependent dioxygenase AlkB [Sphingomonas sp.]MBV9529113.1 alpha-ketoglutarate-dependent dioxygenase AlkB [Sphingomonas sp.]
MTTDLFDAAVVPGLVYRADVVSAVEHDALVARLDAMDLDPFRFHGWVGNRRTRTFGWRYDFDDASFAPTDPIPDWLLPLRIRAAALASVSAEEFAHVLLARYDPGAGIGWHRDRPQFEHVVGFSLASPATMRFRQRTPSGFRRANAHLEPRSAYLLSGEVRHDWEHSIVPGDALRFSVTFRTLSAKGRRLAAAT